MNDFSGKARKMHLDTLANLESQDQRFRQAAEVTRSGAHISCALLPDHPDTAAMGA